MFILYTKFYLQTVKIMIYWSLFGFVSLNPVQEIQVSRFFTNEEFEEIYKNYPIIQKAIIKKTFMLLNELFKDIIIPKDHVKKCAIF